MVKIESFSFDKASRRIGKFLRFGNADSQTAIEASPHGIDGAPVKGKMAVYARTSNYSKKVLIGYLNTNQISDPGELRLYSTDDQGVEQAYAWLRNDGNLELNGDQDFIVRFSQLESAFNTLKADLNTLISTYNAHTHVYSPGPSPAAPTAPTTSTGTPSNADVSGAKVDNVKTN